MTVQNMTHNVKLDTTDYIQNVQSVTMGNHSADSHVKNKVQVNNMEVSPLNCVYN